MVLEDGSSIDVRIGWLQWDRVDTKRKAPGKIDELHLEDIRSLREHHGALLLLIVAREVETIEDIAEGVATVHLFYLPEVVEVLLAVGSIFKFTIYSGRRLATCYAHLVVGGGRRVCAQRVRL